ncbi:MAG: T9SS type A sorting domain-containing protein [Bacteroidetes bacterium]|nr:MAG: T9SS type A sorting domain-containing protein [Bacteroidota bacterium]
MDNLILRINFMVGIYMKKKLLILCILFFVFLNFSYSQQTESCYPWVKSIHTELGTPCDDDTTNDYIIIRYQYVLSYNKYLGVSNWAAWNLNANWFGDYDRDSCHFTTDTSLPAGFYRVKNSDYTNSGYDRGHIVRAEERSKNAEDMKSTFLMTNIIPQTADLNQGVWLNFEYFYEDLCKQQNKELFIYSGGIFHTKNTLNDEGKVIIPDSCFKIVVVFDRGQTLKDINSSTLVYSVIMPNIDGVRNDAWTKYITSVNSIETSTGYNFLSNVPDSVQQIIESQIGTSVDEKKEEGNYIIYPNPANSFLNINKINNLSPEIIQIKFYSCLGLEILLPLPKISGNQIQFDITSLIQGVYHICIFNNDQIMRLSLLKQE